MNTRTFTQNGATFTFRNTMRAQIRYLQMVGKFVKDIDADRNARTSFCYVMAYLDSVENWPFERITEADTLATFEASYYGYAESVSGPEYWELVGQVNELLVPLADEVEKPDDALTPEQQADPN